MNISLSGNKVMVKWKRIRTCPTWSPYTDAHWE